MQIPARRSGLKCRSVSDLLEAAAAALSTPADLVERSAAARAAANGTTVDEVLSAWAGGAPVAAAAPATSPPAEAVAEEAAAEEAAAEEAVAPEETPVTAVAAAEEAVAEAPVIEVAPVVAPVVAEVEYEPEPEEPLVPVSIGTRMRTAVRVGAWTGAALGLVAFLIASGFWASSAAVTPDSGPFVQANPTSVMIGVALASVAFGAIVAGFSRAAAGWTNPAMQLSSSKPSTAWLGAFIGLVLGIVAGALLTAGFGTEIEGSGGLIQLPVLPTLAVMLAGGAILGAVTAAIAQLIGTPVAVEEEDRDEVSAVKGRLGNAMSIPAAGTVLLLLLVLPFGYILIQSNQLAPGRGAAIVAILAASGILGFAALAGSKPEMRISFGDLMVAIVGIGTVLLIIVAVLFYVGANEDGAEDGSEENATAIVQTV